MSLSESDKKAISEALLPVLADHYALYLKMQGYHWNVTGPAFYALHKLFGKKYQSLAKDVDEIAERIRTLGPKVAASFSEFQRLSSIEDGLVDLKAGDMISDLVKGYETLIQKIRKVFKLAEKADDQVTMDLLTSLLSSHEQTVWGFKSTLQ
ncbi:MAG: DNA starvation/stationary phase protection protein [Bdellovibrionales bacterium]|nr:DNA starvation/stationary phase protection protein [Bdellovibrionales bacterium]